MRKKETNWHYLIYVFAEKNYRFERYKCWFEMNLRLVDEYNATCFEVSGCVLLLFRKHLQKTDFYSQEDLA
jgi:hypothetical protein